MAEWQSDRRSEFRQGFVSALPIWLGIVPFAAAFALLARAHGFSRIETLAMSLFVFAGSAQLAIVDLASNNAGGLAILMTVLLLNLRHVLYAMTLDLKLARPRSVAKPVLAAGMTDEAMGLTIAHGRNRPSTDWFFMGTAVSLYLAFGATTLLAAVLGGRIPEPDRLHLDIVFPLTFLALLLPLVRSKRSLLIALAAATLSVALRGPLGASNAILLAILGGAMLGFLLPSTEAARPSLPSEDLPS